MSSTKEELPVNHVLSQVIPGFMFVLVIGLSIPSNAQDHSQDLSNLPLPELNFEEEEDAPVEYLVDRPTGYLKLPRWADSVQLAIDLGRPLNLGGGLWPGQESLLPGIADRVRQKRTQPNGFRRPEDPRLALPNVQRLSPDAIPEAYLPHYFGEAPKRHLTDVQRLLSDSAWQDTDWFLTYHSNECRYSINVLLFASDEQIPDSVSGPELLDRWFPEHDHVLVFYFNGRPERAQVFFPENLASNFPEADFQQNLMEAIASASRSDAAGTQLDEFCQKLGTWLLWWEKRLRVSRPDVTSAEKDPDIPLVGTVAAESNVTDNATGRGFGSIGFGLIGTVALGLVGLTAWAIPASLKRKRKRPLIFPERQSPRRLGAPHSGGGSVVLTFGAPR